MTHKKFICHACGHESQFVSDLMDTHESGNLFANVLPNRSCPRCGAEYPLFGPSQPAANEEATADEMTLEADQIGQL
jgi:rubredoxin